MDDDALEAALNGSAPRVRATSRAEDEEIRRLAESAQFEARRRDRMRAPRVIVGVAIAAVLVGGAGTAAAVTADDWAPWAQTPDGVYHYTLPSGAVCEARVGNMQGADPEVVEAFREIYAEVDVVAEADVEAALAEIREGENRYFGENGWEPGGYGTENYNADTEYDQAMDLAIHEVVERELRERGIGPGNSYASFEGERHCPGAQW